VARGKQRVDLAAALLFVVPYGHSVFEFGLALLVRAAVFSGPSGQPLRRGWRNLPARPLRCRSETRVHAVQKSFGLKLSHCFYTLNMSLLISGSSPCASTNDFNRLYGGILAILTTGQPLIVTNALYLFALHAAFGRQR